MNTKKFIIGGLVGGIVYFLLGYVFYGNLLSDFFHNHAGTATGVDRPMDQFVWWSLALGNIFGGCLLAYVFIKSNVSSVGSGLVTGAVIGLLVACSYDFTSYGVSNLTTRTGLLGDIGTFTVMSAIAGAIVAWVCGLVGKGPLSKT
ncbi:MAG: hypothetical protein ACRDE8_09910 [Ginsengibacter sp.]